MKELLTEWRKLPSKENKNISEGRVKELWYECMDELVEMALDNGYVACCCASKALDKVGMGSHDAETSLQLIADCIGDGMLAPMPHPKHAQVTVYMAID